MESRVIVDSQGQYRRKRQWWVSTLLSIAAIVISLVTLGFTFWQERLDIATHSPPAYAVFRGFGVFPSDHLALPIDLVNRGGTSVVLRNIRLELTHSPPDGEPVIMLLAGELDPLLVGPVASPGPLRLTQSLVLPGRSATTRLLMFHIENWSERSEEGKFPDFRFPAPACYHATLSFAVNESSVGAERVSFWLVINTAVNDLRESGEGLHWDYFALDGDGC